MKPFALYRRGSRNPFHSWWFGAAYLFNPIFRLFGFAIMLRRCSWTKCGGRLTLGFVGWCSL